MALVLLWIGGLLFIFGLGSLVGYVVRDVQG